ncbi:MAG: hypothetical protein JW755_03330 [Candidatus Aminicenantes bacterium]|nr:hypothetical protein [Candidatus Aminicenantes bacterium]
MQRFFIFYIVCVLAFMGIATGKVSSSVCLDEEMYPPLFSDNFEDGDAGEWKPHFPDNWGVRKEEGSFVYKLIAPGEPGRIRAPYSWSILAEFDVSGFVFQGRLRCNEDIDNPYRDVVILFNFQDPEHFYYVHFSAISDEVHNIIGLVNGRDRVKVNLEPPGESKAILNDDRFHDFKVTYAREKGEICAYLDDLDIPILSAVDKTLKHGAVGLGSFDDIADFDEIRLWGNIYRDRPDQ